MLLLMLTLLQGVATLLPPADARQIALSAPSVVTVLDTDDRDGHPTRLCWSPDSSLLYVRTTRMDRWANEKNRHWLIDLADGTVRESEFEPPWAAAYWAVKSPLAAPGVPGVRIAMEVREERRTATGIVGAGAMAGNPGDPSLGSELGPQGAAIASSVLQGQVVRTTTLKLKGQLLGRFENVPAVSGLTYGWGPAMSGLLAYSDDRRGLFLLDGQGHRRAVAGTKEAWLPAWSPDLSRLAVVDRVGKKKYEVKVFDRG
jgi:hypothetical protein